MMTTRHAIPTIPSPYDYEQGRFKSHAILRIAGACRTGGPGGWGLGGWTKEGTGRLVFKGPKEQGPQGFVFGRAGVIDTRGGTGREHRDAVAKGLLFDVEDGDELEMAGTVYKLTIDRRGQTRVRGRCRHQKGDENASVDKVSETGHGWQTG